MPNDVQLRSLRSLDAVRHKAAQHPLALRYAQTCANGTEVPVIFDSQELIAKIAHHLHPCDYKAAAVYTRSAFEKLIRKHCEGRSKKLEFKSQIGKIMLTIQLRFTLTNPMPPRINRIKGKQKQRGETV